MQKYCLVLFCTLNTESKCFALELLTNKQWQRLCLRRQTNWLNFLMRTVLCGITRLWWWVKRPIKRDGPSQISSFCLPCPLFSVMWKWYIFWSMTIRLHNWTGQICTRKVCVISRNSLGISKIDDIYGKGSLCIPNWMSQISFDPHLPRLYFVNYIANFSQIHQNYTRNTPKKSTIKLFKMAPIPIWNSSEKNNPIRYAEASLT